MILLIILVMSCLCPMPLSALPEFPQKACHSGQSSCTRDPALKLPILPSDQAMAEKPRIYIFVSLSMPEISLKALAKEAEQKGATLVMRGLYQNSFAQTAQKLQELGIEVDIHPQLFAHFNIHVVPTFVKTSLVKTSLAETSLVHDSEPERIQSLRGHVTLAFALRTFEEAP
jgi:conjugal transfer pilus assembly protein TrbC